MPYNIKLEIFEGPFELLFHLLEKDEIDIYDIPIARITEQYLAYLHTMEELNLEIAGEFLVMAATLLQIKAKMLLPEHKPEELLEDGEERTEDPREELVIKLLEYKRFKEVSLQLKEKEIEMGNVFRRPVTMQVETPDYNPLEGVSVKEIFLAFQKVLAKAVKVEPQKITREKVTVQDKMLEIVRFLVHKESGSTFTECLLSITDHSRLELIITFMALLELIKLGRVKVKQEGAFKEIIIKPVISEAIPESEEVILE